MNNVAELEAVSPYLIYDREGRVSYLSILGRRCRIGAHAIRVTAARLFPPDAAD